MNVRDLRDAVAYGPRDVTAHADLLGWWTRDGYWLCAYCGARLLGRGVVGELSEPEWKGPNQIQGLECQVCSAVTS